MFFNTGVSGPFYPGYQPQEINGIQYPQGYNYQILPSGQYVYPQFASQVNPQFRFPMYPQPQAIGHLVATVDGNRGSQPGNGQGDNEDQSNLQKRKQNPTRNMNSNAMKYFVKFLRNAQKVDNNIDTIVKLHNLKKYSRKDFKKTLQNIFFQGKSYIRPSTIAELCSNGEREAQKYPGCGPEFRLILRILLHRFIDIDYFPFIVKMKKFKIRERKKQLQSMRRQLLHLLMQ